jgi:maltose alpha-D-glucosyltransferase/alpha-amylase
MLLPGDAAAARSNPHAVYLAQMRQLGVRTAELHRALCPATADKSFKPEKFNPADLRAYIRAVRADGQTAFRMLAAAAKKLPPPAAEQAARLLSDGRGLLRKIGENLPADIGTMKTRLHGDYHLGHVVVSQNDFFILDFEGEPGLTLAERRRKHLPIKDVAGIVRSLDYAAWVAVDRVTADHPDRRDALIPFALAWRDEASAAFLAAYRETMGVTPSYPQDAKTADALLRLATLEKLFYEMRYELANRPAWATIPITGASHMLHAST